ncbi:MAG: hypothetical protein HY043_24190 [Verrucomicrobia bacterium]|nr:hypothetical protein [Verrucomicrobiota bacterium]
MNDKLNTLFAKIKELEHELLTEMREKEHKFGYEVRENKVRFQEVVAAQHQKIAKNMARYLKDAKLFSIVTAPVIWFCIVPVVFMHLVADAYQFICFPIYGIPKVRRQDYIVMDRRRLHYLNSMERFNCVYCEYVNGLLAYVQEIAARTEQYWCPIKHAMSLKTRHSRYQHFMDYGDAENYRQRIEAVRRDFDDLKKS